jgi:uncharacterized glyoxalase superfamily protein PhnB
MALVDSSITKKYLQLLSRSIYELKKRGVDISDVETQAWGKFVHFNDPDGNAWTLQELPPRSQSKV